MVIRGAVVETLLHTIAIVPHMQAWRDVSPQLNGPPGAKVDLFLYIANTCPNPP